MFALGPDPPPLPSSPSELGSFPLPEPGSWRPRGLEKQPGRGWLAPPASLRLLRRCWAASGVFELQPSSFGALRSLPSTPPTSQAALSNPPLNPERRP